MSRTEDEKTTLHFKMIQKSGRTKQVSLSMELEDCTLSPFRRLAKKNKISLDLQGRWIIMLKYNTWDDFFASSKVNCRSMNMEAKKIITDYFSSIDSDK